MTHAPVNDPRVFGRVLVLLGGSSAERQISLASGRAVLDSLRRQGIDVQALDPFETDLIHAVQDHKPDRVFIIMHGRGGEDGTVQGVLDFLGIPYTGSGLAGSALTMDKMRCKWVWQGCGLATPHFAVVRQDSDPAGIRDEVGFPMVVKPSAEGSSLGMSIVRSLEEIPDAWALARRYGRDVFAEQWVEGREYTVAIIKDRALPAVRIETPRQFYDYTAKYDATDTRYYCPAGLDSDREKVLDELALEAFAVVGARGWGRVDLICDRNDQPWLIEINTVPGMTDHSLVPKAAQAAQISFDQLVWQILETSIV